MGMMAGRRSKLAVLVGTGALTVGIGPAIRAGVTEIQVQSEPIVVGNWVAYKAIHKEPPPNPVDHFEWSYACKTGDCAGTYYPVGGQEDTIRGPGDEPGAGHGQGAGRVPEHLRPEHSPAAAPDGTHQGHRRPGAGYPSSLP